MKYRINNVIFFLLYHCIINTQSNQPLDFVCVSLGFNCTPALQLKSHNLRQLSFPFDWTISSMQGVCDLIENNFVDFLNPLYLAKTFGLFNTKYKIAFMHDFPVHDSGDGTFIATDNYEEFLEAAHTKYRRRINRFLKVCDLAKTVYFIRLGFTYWKFDVAGQTPLDIIKLRNALLKIFPSENWVLVAIDTTANYRHAWNIDKVKNFYISDHTANAEWTSIFKSLGILCN